MRAFARRQARLRPPGFRDSASREIQRILLSTPPWLGAGMVLCYVALPGEVDTEALMAAARSRGRRLGVPRVDGSEISFRLAPASGSALSQGPLGVLEPGVAAPVLEPRESEPALVLVPGLLFDLAGNRLGRGGGHYDRFLARARRAAGVVAVGLCFDEQVVPELPTDPWDERVDWIVTERRGLVKCAARAGGPGETGRSAP
jgi:5-formyltetrahydrofolate cyclo-ligase